MFVDCFGWYFFGWVVWIVFGKGYVEGIEFDGFVFYFVGGIG